MKRYENSSVINSGYRSIADGKEYDSYFPKPEKQDRIIINDGEVEDTVQLMEKVVWKYIDDTKSISSLFKRNSVEETCNAIWEFLYNTIQYRLDKPGLEQLRRPARSWQERKAGVDCDCLSIFASSILTNLQIPHSFRITKYSADYWQHVYVIVPTTGKSYCTIDAVVSKFDYEKPYSEKMDYQMSLKGINVAVLSGTSDDDLTDVLLANHLNGFGLGDANPQQELDQLYQYLVATRNAIAKDPKLVATTDDPGGLLKMLDYAIQYWNTDKRDEALAVLEKNEQKLNLRNGFPAMSGYMIDYDDSLGAIKMKGFFSSIKKAASTVGKGVQSVTKVVGKGVQTAAKATAKGVQVAAKATGKGVQVAAKAVVRFNPLSIAARNGFLLAMKLDVSKMATHLKWGYATKEQAQKKGISETQWIKAKDSREKVEKLFADKLQGERSALQNAVLKGKAGNLNGVIEDQMLGLGDPLTASSLATAAPIIKMVIDILKKAGNINPNENIDADQIEKEIAADPQSAEALKTIESENAAMDESMINANADASSTKGGIIGFIKANPVPAAIGGGLLALGIYKMVTPSKKKPAVALNGIKKTIAKRKAKPEKKKVRKNNQPTLSVKKLPFKTLILK